jgi:hypothetical protein
MSTAYRNSHCRLFQNSRHAPAVTPRATPPVGSHGQGGHCFGHRKFGCWPVLGRCPVCRSLYLSTRAGGRGVLFTDYMSVGAVTISRCRLAEKGIEFLRTITAAQERKMSPCRSNAPPAEGRACKSAKCEKWCGGTMYVNAPQLVRHAGSNFRARIHPHLLGHD